MVEDERNTGEPGDAYDRILAHATRLFVASGYPAISMREIAEAAGISKPGLYYHFRDKEALFLALSYANLDQVELVVEAAGQAGRTCRERITGMMRALLALSPHQRAIIRLASQEMVHVSPAARTDFEQVYRQKFLGRVETLLADGIAAGELRPVDTRFATWLLLGMAYPFFDANHQPAGDPSEAADLMVAVFFDGLAARL
jgi:AcrR family transcriptional regulator